MMSNERLERQSRVIARFLPSKPVPAGELNRYSPERDYDAEKEITD
jgi:hypothetical protein